MLLEAATLHGVASSSIAADAKEQMQRKFAVQPIDLEPRVYYRITDNWLELTVRFLLGTHQIRVAKDAMYRHIIRRVRQGRRRHRLVDLRHRRLSEARDAGRAGGAERRCLTPWAP